MFLVINLYTNNSCINEIVWKTCNYQVPSLS